MVASPPVPANEVSELLDALYHGRHDEVGRLLAERGTDTLTIHEAAETTGWSPRMLRYIERIGLIDAPRSGSGYRRRTCWPAGSSRSSGW